MLPRKIFEQGCVSPFIASRQAPVIFFGAWDSSQQAVGELMLWGVSGGKICFFEMGKLVMAFGEPPFSAILGVPYSPFGKATPSVLPLAQDHSTEKDLWNKCNLQNRSAHSV